MNQSPDRVIELEPEDFAGALAARADDRADLALTPGEQRLLAPAHPFRQAGCWRGFLATHQGQLRARLVASVDRRQTLADRPVGAIGFIAGSGDTPAFLAALRRAERWLQAQGAVVARCPIQFSTWFGQRAMTAGFPDEGGLPPFLLEPSNPRSLVDGLDQAGYLPASRAVSYLVEHDRVIAGAEPGLERLQVAGFQHRPIDLANLPAELTTLHGLVQASFAGSWGFSPATVEEFATYFGPLVTIADPDLIRLLFDPAGRPAGFLFASPAGGSAESPRLVVVKTLGVVPEARQRHPGLGFGLVAAVHAIARARGYAAGIHALMTQGSAVERRTARWGRWMRSYATFERTLEGNRP